jgi:uncharacterized protein (TIGR04551 family)
MRTPSRLVARLSGCNQARAGVLGGWLAAAAVLLAAGTASAQQPAPAPAPPPPGDAPLIPPAPSAAPAPPAAAPGTPPTAPAPLPLPPAPDADRDAKALSKQGAERPVRTGGGLGSEVPERASDVFAEDWWTGARPTFEIHGYYRVRAELFHNFSLGRQDAASIGLWPQPADNSYTQVGANGQVTQKVNVALCGSSPIGTNGMGLPSCSNISQASANMRFRLNPELHISDNLRIMSQIDLLDNLVLGSTPQGYYNLPATTGGYQAQTRGGYTPLGIFTTTQWAPVAGVNSTTNSITVKRVWGEFMTPFGLLRFGRMPSNWGLGMVANSGDGYDSDYQTDTDRIMFLTGIKKYDLYFAGMWDFANSGSTTATFAEQQGQPTVLAQLVNVNEWGLVAVRKRDPELQRLDLAKGNPVFNGGAYVIYRNQFLANDQGGAGTQSQAGNIGQTSSNYTTGLSRRGAWAIIPDLWFQFLYKKFRFEAEGAMIYGDVESLQNVPLTQNSGYLNPSNPSDPGYHVRQGGVATQSEFRAIEDRLRIRFDFGWASGDPGLTQLAPSPQQLQPKTIQSDRTYTEFAFHPDYRVDLIFFRNILTRVEGAYYFKPGAEYDFIRDKSGQKVGGGANVIWSRASEFIQTPGHQHDLGVEIDGKVYYQSKDGTLNDDHNKMGGFYTQIEYGVFFPLPGLGYLPGQQTNYQLNQTGGQLGTSVAQIVRWYIGVLY